MTEFRNLRHSLRTPLNHIIGYSEMLIEDATAAGRIDVLNQLNSIHAAGQELLQAIQRRLVPSLDTFGQDEFSSLARETSEAIKIICTQASGLAATYDFGRIDLERIAAAAATLREYLHSSAVPEKMPEIAQRALSGRLLVVDDDETNRDILKRQLERQGYQVETAPGGKEAIRRLGEASFDVLLLDIVMPGMDGFQVLSEMKAHPRLRHVPVIVISALDEMESVSRCIEMGADDFISKPFDRVILRARIGAACMRRQAERERSQLFERFRLLLESTGEGIFGIDQSGKCTFINAAAIKMLGYSRDEILGKPISESLRHGRPGEETAPKELCHIHRAANLGEACRITDELFYRRTGEPFPVEYTANPIMHDGENQGAVITFSNISERMRNEEKFREAAKLESLGVLAGGIAHDFNNLLTGILGNASLVLYSPDLPAGDRDKLEQVVKSSESAAELTRQMLAYAGKGRYEVRPVDMSALVYEYEDLLGTLIPGTVHLRLDLATVLPAVEADPSQMQQIVMNLAINAGEAIGEPHKGIITIRTYVKTLDKNAIGAAGIGDIVPGAYVVTEVSDTGSGMSPEVKARIFEPFYTTKFAGRGLGLAAVQGIVKSHKGAIGVESVAGKGTTISVYLPASSRTAPSPRETVRKLRRLATARIMVVDDEEVIRSTTHTVLASAGHETILAGSGEEAISIFKKRSNEVSLVLLDMMMPGMGGDEVLKFLRAIRPDISVIVSSGYAEAQVMKYFAGRRLSGFIQKPYAASGLLEVVGAALGAST